VKLGDQTGGIGGSLLNRDASGARKEHGNRRGGASTEARVQLARDQKQQEENPSKAGAHQAPARDLGKGVWETIANQREEGQGLARATSSLLPRRALLDVKKSQLRSFDERDDLPATPGIYRKTTGQDVR